MTGFSRIVAVSAIGRHPDVRDHATASECAAVADRLGLAAVTSLVVEARLALTADGAMLTGAISADITQTCVATNLPISTMVRVDFALRYVRALDLAGPAGEDGLPEIALGADDCDVLPLEAEQIDVGEAAVQTLALAIDPYPRHRDADRVLRDAGVLREVDAGPFAALAALKTPNP